MSAVVQLGKFFARFVLVIRGFRKSIMRRHRGALIYRRVFLILIERDSFAPDIKRFNYLPKWTRIYHEPNRPHGCWLLQWHSSCICIFVILSFIIKYGSIKNLVLGLETKIRLFQPVDAEDIFQIIFLESKILENA